MSSAHSRADGEVSKPFQNPDYGVRLGWSLNAFLFPRPLWELGMRGVGWGWLQSVGLMGSLLAYMLRIVGDQQMGD